MNMEPIGQKTSLASSEEAIFSTDFDPGITHALT